MEAKIKIPVIWSDEHLLVINKPAGLLTLPDGYDPSVPHLKSVLSPSWGPLWIVHRLDRNTSGVIILARSADSHRLLNIQFQERQVNKVYHALVLGDPIWESKIVDLPLRVNAGRKHRTVVDLREGKQSLTQFKVLERYGNYCLMKAAPQTGRRHQIRAHINAEGFSIACDDLYASGSENDLSDIKTSFEERIGTDLPLMTRSALHARSIEFSHPITLEPMSFEAPYPQDFRVTLDKLRMVWS